MNAHFSETTIRANPDEELYRALLPGLGRVTGSLLIGISSAYKKSGLLWRKFDENFGKESDTVLVIKAPTMTMNPSIDRAEVERAMLEDPVGGSAEWLSQFREDISGFVSLEVVNGCTAFGIIERPPAEGITYFLFFDIANGGSGGDSAAVAVAHKDHDGNKLILDYLREFKAPFSPSVFLDAVAAVADRYRISDCWADGFAKGLVGDRLKDHNKRFCDAPLVKSAIYAEILSWLNSYSVIMLDSQRLRSQLLSLDRRPGAAGKEIIEHPRRLHAHDDVANAACGALMLAAAAARRGRINVVGISLSGSSSDRCGIIRDGRYISADQQLLERPPPPTDLSMVWDDVKGWHRPWIDPNCLKKDRR